MKLPHLWATATFVYVVLISVRADATVRHISFDALTNRITTYEAIHNGDDVDVVITHPNSFRDVYTVKVDTQDFHTSPPDDRLKALLALNGQAPTPQPGSQPQGAGQFRRIQKLPDRTTTAAVANEYSELAKAYNQTIDDVVDAYGLITCDHRELMNTTSSDIYGGSTNSNIRLASTVHMGKFLHDIGGSGKKDVTSLELAFPISLPYDQAAAKSNKDLYTQDVPDFSKGSMLVLQSVANDLAYLPSSEAFKLNHDFQQTIRAKIAFDEALPNSQAEVAELKQADFDLLKKDVNTAITELADNDLSADLSNASKLYTATVDPVFAPSQIDHLSFHIGGDQVTATVTVDSTQEITRIQKLVSGATSNDPAAAVLGDHAAAPAPAVPVSPPTPPVAKATPAVAAPVAKPASADNAPAPPVAKLAPTAGAPAPPTSDLSSADATGHSVNVQAMPGVSQTALVGAQAIPVSPGTIVNVYQGGQPAPSPIPTPTPRDATAPGDQSKASDVNGNVVQPTDQITLKETRRRLVDFTTGFVGTSLISKNYQLVPNAIGGSTKVVAVSASDKLDFGTAAFGHYYVTNKQGMSIGPALGVTLSNSPVRYLLGLGAVLGNRNRLALTGGWAFGKVSELNGDVVGQPPINGSSVQTHDAWRYGYFVGLSFSINLKNP